MSTTNPNRSEKIDNKVESESNNKSKSDTHEGRVPVWPAFIALIIVGVLFSLLSAELTIGRIVWLVPVVIFLLLVFIIFSWIQEKHDISRLLARISTSIMTIALIISVVLLMQSLIVQGIKGPDLLRDAAILWASNVIVFALWYWELDGGGPAERHKIGYNATDFLFPQILVGGKFSENWKPGFIDYLYLAFNTNTAFSPTDTSVISKRAKVIMMIQSLLALITIAVIAARAVNIIPSNK